MNLTLDNDIKQKFNELTDLIKNAQSENEKTETTLNILNELSAKLNNGNNSNSSATSKLKLNSAKALEEAEYQLKYYQNILFLIQDLRKKDEISKLQGTTTIRRGVLMSLLQENAKSLPLWVGNADEISPDLCGKIKAADGIILEAGTKVAALVCGNNPIGPKPSSFDENNESECWILADVLQFDNKSHNYTVEDVDIEEGKQRFKVSPNKIIPLPKYKADPILYPEAIYDKGSEVLGLYPQTTCFYKAIVKQSPSHIHDDYSLFFEDPSYPEGFAPALNIPQKYVISITNTLEPFD